MKRLLLKGLLMFCFFITIYLAADGQTAAYTSIITGQELTATAGKAIAKAATNTGPDAALINLNQGSFDIPFVRCNNNPANTNYVVNIKNASATKATNQSYTIAWGDGESSVFGNNFDVTSHTYKSLGEFDLVLTVTGTDGSTSSRTYNVYNGRIPNLAMGSPDNTGGCAPQTYIFPIGGVANNSPGTKYTFTFDDGTPPLNFTQENIPAFIEHIFDQSSCSRPGEVFTLTGVAESPCGSTELKVFSRKIGAKPKPGFAVAKEILCTNEILQFNNTTLDGSSISNTANCKSESVHNWKIEPATGWTMTSGDNASKNIAVNFTAPGVYKVTLTSGNDCGSEEIVKEITAVHPPKADFSINQTEACNNLRVATINTSEGSNVTYTWSVSPNSGYTLESGTLTSTNPVFNFTELGRYTITLSATTGCAPAIATKEVMVTGAPIVSLPQAQTYCAPQAIKFDANNTAHAPVYNANSGTITGYIWSVTGNATFVSPTNRNSQYPEIYFPTAGTYTVTLKATSACGESVAATQLVTIEESRITNTLGDDQQVCYNQPVSITSGTLTGGSGSYTYLWESSTALATTGFAPAEGKNNEATYTSGALTESTWLRRKVIDGTCVSISNVLRVVVVPAISGNIITGDQTICSSETPARLSGPEPTGGLGAGSFTYAWEYSTTDAASGFKPVPDATGSDYLPEALAPATWYRRVARSGNCEETSLAVQVIVNPLPDAPQVAAQEVCTGRNAVLSVGSHNGTCEWFSDETSAKAIFAGHSFDTPVLNATTTYYVQVTNASGCSTPRIPVTVTVYPLTTVNTLSANQLLCIGEKPGGLTGSTPTGGDGTYTFLWEQSTDNKTYTAASGINDKKDYQPPMLARQTWYRRVVFSNSCENISDPVQIVINSPVSNNTISSAQSVCSGSKPAALTGSLPTGGGSNFTYLWESSTTSATTGFASAAGFNDGADYVPEKLTRTTWFRRKVISLPCQENICEAVLVTVESQPPAPHLPKGATICPATNAILKATSPLPTYSLQWFREPEGGLPLYTGETYTTDQLYATTDYYVQTLNQIGCPSARVKVTATVVKPLINAGPDLTIIAGREAQLNATGGESYSWSPALSLSNLNIPDPVAKPEVTTTYTVTVTTREGCTFTDEVTVEALPKVLITNAITVNGDGLNDTWFIKNIENYPNCQVQVFTRWGAKVFESVGYRQPWDGTHQGRALPMSAYYYIIKLTEKEDALTGSITLIK